MAKVAFARLFFTSFPRFSNFLDVVESSPMAAASREDMIGLKRLSIEPVRGFMVSHREGIDIVLLVCFSFFLGRFMYFFLPVREIMVFIPAFTLQNMNASDFIPELTLADRFCALELFCMRTWSPVEELVDC